MTAPVDIHSPSFPTQSGDDLLVGTFRRALQETQFTNTRIPPRRMQQIVSAMARAFEAFHDKQEPASVQAHGQRLAQDGLSHQSILAAVQVVYNLSYTTDPEHQTALALAHGYTTALLEGYMQEREAQLLREQERTRRALDRARVGVV